MAIKKSAKASVKKAKFLELDNTNIMVEYAKRDAKGNVIDETYKKVDRFREWDETEAHLKLLDSPDSSCPDIVKYTDTRWDLVTIEDGSFKYIDGSANIFTHTTYSNPVFTESTGGVTITNPNSIDMTANITNFVTESVSLSANSGDLKRISKGYTAGTYTIDCQLLSVTGKGWSNKASYTFNVTQLEMPTISDSQIKIFITNPNSVDVDCYYSNYLSGTVSIGAGKTITLDKTNVLGTFTLDAYLRCEGYADSNNKSYTFLVEKYTLSNPTVKFISSSASISIYNPNGVNVTAKITFGSSTKTISVPATTTTTTTTNFLISKVSSGSNTIYTKLSATDWNDSNSVSTTFALTSIEAVILNANSYLYTSSDIGTTISIPVNGTNYTFQLIGVNHDILASGSSKKANTTWQMVNLLSTKYNMNSSDTNSGGWGSSAMRTRCNSTFLGYLPDAIQNNIKKVKKYYYSTYNSSSSLTTCTDSVFLLSSTELTGASFGSAGNTEGSIYSYWSNHNSNSDRVKTLSGSAGFWWLRSSYSSNSYYFVLVISGGDWDYYYASSSFGVSFAFCL